MGRHNIITVKELKQSLNGVPDTHEIFIEDIKTYELITGVIIKARPPIKKGVKLSALFG